MHRCHMSQLSNGKFLTPRSSSIHIKISVEIFYEIQTTEKALTKKTTNFIPYDLRDDYE
jgi:hypothetical protein